MECTGGGVLAVSTCVGTILYTGAYDIYSFIIYVVWLHLPAIIFCRDFQRGVIGYLGSELANQNR